MRLLNSLWMILFVSMVLVLTSCIEVHNAELTDDKRIVTKESIDLELEKNETDSIEVKQDSEKGKKNLIEIQEAKIMGWWWNKEVVEKGFDGDNPPHKENYLEIVTWQYDGEGFTTFPKEVDFISKLENKSRTSFEGIIRYNLKAKYGNNSTDIECKDYPLKDEGNIFEQKISFNKNESKVIKKQNFDLNNLLIKEVNGSRICLLQFSVEVVDSQGNKIIERQTEMPIILGD